MMIKNSDFTGAVCVRGGVEYYDVYNLNDVLGILPLNVENYYSVAVYVCGPEAITVVVRLERSDNPTGWDTLRDNWESAMNEWEEVRYA